MGAEAQMLRTLVLTLAIVAPGVAMAQPAQFPDAARGAEVRGDDGTVIGRVGRVERNARGEIVSAEIAGLEPADAPIPVLVARNDDRREVLIRYDRRSRDRQAQYAAADRAR